MPALLFKTCSVLIKLLCFVVVCSYRLCFCSSLALYRWPCSALSLACIVRMSCSSWFSSECICADCSVYVLICCISDKIIGILNRVSQSRCWCSAIYSCNTMCGLSFSDRYLIPCNHMMLSQRRVLRERDCYSVSAAKFLALTPSCCSPEVVPPPLRQLDSILWSKVTDGSHIGTIGIMLFHYFL